MEEFPEATPPEWDLAEWEKALTIHVGRMYVCRACGNLAVVTRGGVGMMEMVCCGKAMDPVQARDAGRKGEARP
jgi:hypothetical protein